MIKEPESLRIVPSTPAVQAVNRRFVSLFFVFAADFALAAFYRPALVPFVLGFPVCLVLWRQRLRRAHRPGALVISEATILVEGHPVRPVLRSDTRSVQVLDGEASAAVLQIFG